MLLLSFVEYFVDLDFSERFRISYKYGMVLDFWIILMKNASLETKLAFAYKRFKVTTKEVTNNSFRIMIHNVIAVSVLQTHTADVMLSWDLLA